MTVETTSWGQAILATIAERDRQIAMQQQRLTTQAEMIAGLRRRLDQTETALLAKDVAISELQRRLAESAELAA